MRLFNTETNLHGPVPSDTRPVIIVGAGPVGLSLALGLSQNGVPVKVFEALPELSPDARCSTIHPASLEIFDEWGVIEPVLAKGHKVNKLQYWERETREVVAELPYDRIAEDTPYPYRLQCPQSVLTRVLKPEVEASALGDGQYGPCHDRLHRPW